MRKYTISNLQSSLYSFVLYFQRFEDFQVSITVDYPYGLISAPCLVFGCLSSTREHFSRIAFPYIHILIYQNFTIFKKERQMMKRGDRVSCNSHYSQRIWNCIYARLVRLSFSIPTPRNSNSKTCEIDQFRYFGVCFLC